MTAALSLAWDTVPRVPFWENRTFYAVILAFTAGMLGQKYVKPNWEPPAKSFRLTKSNDKW
jgi:hypothetical protein